jgi:hypothetical protein
MTMTTATFIALPVLRPAAAGFYAVMAACRRVRGLDVAEVLVVSLIVRTRSKPLLADSAIRRLGAFYANVGFARFPLNSVSSMQEMCEGYIMAAIILAYVICRFVTVMSSK